MVIKVLTQRINRKPYQPAFVIYVANEKFYIVK